MQKENYVKAEAAYISSWWPSSSMSTAACVSMASKTHCLELPGVLYFYRSELNAPQAGLDQGGGNNTRRSLRVNKLGVYVATNPIDRCWRCQGNWYRQRKRFAQCAKGFGRRTTGGSRGEFYVITDPSYNSLTDPKPGTLRYGVIQDHPLWIVFARGANVHIAYGAGFTVHFVQNIIIHGIHIYDIKPSNGGMICNSEHHFGIRNRSNGDDISVMGSSNPLQRPRTRNQL